MAICGILNLAKLLQFSYKIMAVVLATAIFILCGCSHTEKVLIPPQVDLAPYRIIGVIDFSANAEKDLKQFVTQNYMQSVQAAQPGVRFLELGSQEIVLKKIRHKQLDYEAIRSIGRVYQIDAIMFGNLNLTEAKPNVSMSSAWQSIKAGAYVEATLVTKLWETDSGVIRWTNSSRRKETVARLSANTSGTFRFGATDPKETYGKIIPKLVHANTAEFRSHYEYRKVK